jgi:hypothetical protein
VLRGKLLDAIDAKQNLKIHGCSAHSVPSLSKVAIRSATGTKPGEPGLVTVDTNVTKDCFVLPSFHDDSGSAACAAAVVTASAHHSAAAVIERVKLTFIILRPR